MASSYKLVTTETTVENAINQGYSELQGLRDEMEETASNMEGANEGLANSAKCQACREAADTLDEVADDEPGDVPELFAQLKVTVAESVNRRKGRGPSRSVRCSNAVSALQAAIEKMDSLIDDEVARAAVIEVSKKLVGEGEEPLNEEDVEQAASELRDHLQNAVDTVEGVEFPGFYG